ncbi:MAG: Lipopolysaccharide export system ATP-binding protein LptB [Paracidovorax wautersii]|uniref:Lipopolysaccharide export system ATP-binding protein LptB n=1 Tax=Paracidovorax wautersii TaxID=1177982 RepID=A0A7V8FPE8_9BURK|nr:MAG: Lipopolysaccharide export system ATP-binding protein LptB [Paracidovorax wautersii]
MSGSDLLVAQGIRVGFGGFVALDGVDLRFARGASTGIVGPNGAGKSTLFNVLGGQQARHGGRVLLDGADITGWPAHRRARAGLTRTFQISRELGALTVLENLLLAAPAQPGEGLLGAWLGRAAARQAEEAAVERARALLERIGLWRLADAPADTLSGGQKKLLELCRALMLEPRLVLLDEPAAGVNPVRVGEIVDFIRALQAEGMSFGIVEHNMDMIAALCEPVYVLAQGQVLLRGRFEDVVANPQVAQAYLGGVA